MALIIFPQSNQIPVDDVASTLLAGLTQATSYLGLLRRSVLIQSEPGNWQSVVNIMRVVEQSAEWPPFEPVAATYQGLRVESSPVAPELVSSADGLRRVMSLGMSALPQPDASTHASINRWDGRSNWASWPAWVITLSAGLSRPAPQPPDGPFYDAKGGRIFTTAWEVMRDWTGDESIDQSTGHLARLIVPDLRARFSDIIATATGFEVVVSSNEVGALSCGLLGEDLYGLPVRHLVPVEQNRAVVRANGPLKNFRLLLLEEQSGCLDQHHEFRYAALPGESLLSPLRGRQGALASSLEAALRSGEDLHTEYKEWLPTDRSDSKYADLPETVVAFANTEGGAIYVGLDDHGTISGTDRLLFRAYSSEHGTDLRELRDVYAKLLENIVLTDVRPRIVPEFSWIAADGAWVLEIRIPAVPNHAAYVDKTSECFIRRGSTNKRASPPEIAQLASRQVIPLTRPGIS